jgi:hypothetical protein
MKIFDFDFSRGELSSKVNCDEKMRDEGMLDGDEVVSDDRKLGDIGNLGGDGAENNDESGGDSEVCDADEVA